MNEIEKLYSLAGVEPKCTDECKLADEYWNDEELANKYGTFDRYLQCWCPQNQECTDECKWAYDKFTYPPFTAEKQLELIKWLAKLFIHIDSRDNQIILSSGGGYVSYTAEKLEDAIALLINSKWNIFTEAEQDEIKRILE